MGLNTSYKTQSVLHADGFRCDLCKTYVDFNRNLPVNDLDGFDRPISAVGCVQIHHTFGFGSANDGDSVSVYMCENCLLSLCKERQITIKQDE